MQANVLVQVPAAFSEVECEYFSKKAHVSKRLCKRKHYNLRMD